MMDEFVQFQSIFEMLSDASLDKKVSILNPRMFLVQDSIGSEFIDFFREEILKKFPIREIICNIKKLDKQMEEIESIFEKSDEEESDNIDEEHKTQNSTQINAKLLGKTILFINNPEFQTVEDKERIVEISTFLSKKIKDNLEFYFVLRLEHSEFPRELVNLFDFTFVIPYPSKIQRINIFESLLEQLNIHTVDITHLADLTEDKWNVLDLKRLVDRAFIQWKLLNYTEYKIRAHNEDYTDKDQIEAEDEEQQKKSIPKPVNILNGIPKIPLTGEIFSNLIITGKIRPLSLHNSYKFIETPPIENNIESKIDQQSPSYSKNIPGSTNSFEGLGISEIDSFTSSQLYQYAAANKFEELTSTLEKLDQGKKLDEVDRIVLADFAFILKDPPNRALLKLTNARKTIDRIFKLQKGK